MYINLRTSLIQNREYINLCRMTAILRQCARNVPIDCVRLPREHSLLSSNRERLNHQIFKTNREYHLATYAAVIPRHAYVSINVIHPLSLHAAIKNDWIYRWNNQCRHRDVYILCNTVPAAATPKTRQFAFGALISSATFYARMTRERGKAGCVLSVSMNIALGIRTSEALPRSVMQTDVHSPWRAKR